MSWLYLLAGLFIGCYGTLVGVGGGFLLVPSLLILYPGISPAAITATSLAVVCANTISGSISYGAQRRIDYRSVFLFSIAAAPGAVIGVWVIQFLPRKIFDLTTGVLLIITAIWLFVKKNHNKQSPPLNKTGKKRIITPKNGEPEEYYVLEWTGIWCSLVIGFLSTILGVGGGILHVPIMTFFLGFSPHIAAASSHPIIAIMTGIATLLHWKFGYLTPLAHLLPWLTTGVLIGAPIGAALSRKIHGNLLLQLLALALLITGIRLLFIHR